eukprot:scaffold29223_cov45-Attheya_sp.AAC.1
MENRTLGSALEYESPDSLALKGARLRSGKLRVWDCVMLYPWLGHNATGANTPKRGHTRGGVAIILSPRDTAAWKKAGQPEPTRSGVILGCARFIALSLHFTDHLDETVKINTASIYHPTGVSQQQRSDFLNQLDTLYDKLDGGDEILVTGCDINASIGNRKLIYARADSTEETQYDNVVGPHGIDYLNENGIDLTQ